MSTFDAMAAVVDYHKTFVKIQCYSRLRSKLTLESGSSAVLVMPKWCAWAVRRRGFGFLLIARRLEVAGGRRVAARCRTAQESKRHSAALIQRKGGSQLGDMIARCSRQK